MQSAPVRFLIGLGYATRSKRLRTTGLSDGMEYDVRLVILPLYNRSHCAVENYKNYN